MKKLLSNIFIKQLILLLLLHLNYCDELPQVKSLKGIISGETERTFLNNVNYYSFKGIPFAEPPIQKLRFKPPKPHRGWNGIYEANVNKPTCCQFNTRMRIKEQFGISGSEDCLYLSIYTPALEGSKAIVVFDYNDNFKTGFNGTDTYSPDFFIEEDIVVVTINHRLSALGYLTTGDDIIQPNAGLKDFILGLNWIQENIVNFGGDPTRVTLMGSRGGAALVELMLYTEKARGLFNGIIMQSGSAMEPIYFTSDPNRNIQELAQNLNITIEDSSSLLNQLQEVEIEKLVYNEAKVLDDEPAKKYQTNTVPFTPVVESSGTDAVLTNLPDKSKVVNNVPVLIGFNSRDGLDLVSPVIYEPRLNSETNYETFLFNFPIRPDFRFDRNSSGFEKVMQEIIDFYFRAGYVYEQNVLEYATYVGDILQNYAVNAAAKKLAKDLKSSVYYYMFDFRGSLNENSEVIARNSRGRIENWGATIGDELCYLHLCSRIRKSYKQLSKLVTEQNEMKVLKKMVRMWSNFIKSGNPTPVNNDPLLKNIKWTSINPLEQDINYLHITKSFKMRTNPLGERQKFWDEFLERYGKMAEDGVVKNVVKDEL